MRRLKEVEPYFPIWAEEFEARTREFSDGELGMYMRLLLYQWSRSSVPADEKRVRRIVRSGRKFASRWEIVKSRFVSARDGELQEPTMEEVRRDVQERIEKQRRGGQKGADLRWGREKLAATVRQQDMASEYKDDILERIAEARSLRELSQLEEQLRVAVASD